jgi:hypothetical protein
MDRRRFLLTSLAGALAVPLAAGAQAGKTYRIGVLANVSGGAWGAFIQGLRDVGYLLTVSAARDK